MKFDDAINDVYKRYLLEAEDPAAEPESEGEAEVSVSDSEMATARRYVDRKKILGINIGKSKEVKDELALRKELDDEYDTKVIPDVLDRLRTSNERKREELENVRSQGY